MATRLPLKLSFKPNQLIYSGVRHQMKRIQICWLMLLSAIPGTTLARGSIDFCTLSTLKEPVSNSLTTFTFIDAFPHGSSATSTECPRQRLSIEFAIGNDARAKNFYTMVFRRPSKLSGLREIQAAVDYSPGGIVVKRIHQYRELTDEETEVFMPKFSPQEEEIIRKALGDAANAADSAANR